MSKIRRKVLRRVIEGFALALVLVDAALYFGLVRTFDRWAAVEHQRFTVISRRVMEDVERVARLERFEANLPGGKEQVRLFERDYLSPRRRGFSRAARLVRQLTEVSGLQLSNVSYKLDSARDAPLERLGIELHVSGPFPRLLNFTHALETASDFVVVRDFAFEPAEAGAVDLRLGADLYLVP